MIENNEKLFLPPQCSGLYDNALFGPNQKRCIDLMLILPKSIMSREDIFKMTMGYEGRSPVHVKQEMNKFLGSNNAEQYWMARKHQLEVWKGLVQAEIGEVIDGVEEDDEFELTPKILKKVKGMAGKVAMTTPPPPEKAWEIVTKEAFKDNDKGKDTREPIRVLPASCSQCRHKYDIMNIIIEKGDALDLCKYCNARKRCPDIEDRYLYDIPEDIAKEFEGVFYEQTKEKGYKIAEV